MSHHVTCHVTVSHASSLSKRKRKEKKNKIVSIQVSHNNGLLIIQSKSFESFNAHLFCSYNIALNLLTKFGLYVEHSKTEVFHFFRVHDIFSPPPLNFLPLGGPILSPKTSWQYLGFIFNRKLSFHSYIDFYANKVISIIKCMKILSNSTRDLNPCQKHLLYRCCAMPIALYGFQLWHYNKASLSYPLKIMNKIQRRVAL